VRNAALIGHAGARGTLAMKERRDMRELQLLTGKPVMYVANVDGARSPTTMPT